MKRTGMVLLAGIALMMPVVVQAQVAGSTLLGVSYGELRDVTLGWSAKRQILGHPVYNNMDERIGAVEDIIVTTDKSVSYAIINAGGFLAVAKHNVAIPVSQFQLSGGSWFCQERPRTLSRQPPRSNTPTDPFRPWGRLPNSNRLQRNLMEKHNG